MKGYEMDVVFATTEMCGFPNVISKTSLKYRNKEVLPAVTSPATIQSDDLRSC